MGNTLSFACTLLLTLLFVSCPTFAVTGPEVAQLLNNRYKSTAAECAGNNPAYFCSGVLVRGSHGTEEFWEHGAVSTQSGAESFNYLRADLGTRVLPQKNGVVFDDAFTAIGLGKTLDVLCAYPFEMTLSGERPDHGCGLSTATSATQTTGSCAALGISDAAGWVAHFQQQGQQPEQQCSLSNEPAPFKASLVAHQLIDTVWAAKPNLLLIRNWDAQAPKQLPLQGLFYDTTQTGALLGAQKDQRDYFNVTGDWLPVLRMDLNQAPNGVFGFNQQDQLYVGYQVASRLNERYADTAPACQGDTPAYNCNGVLLRGSQASTAFHMWNPSPGSVANNGVSFTFLRADVQVSDLVFRQGFIVRESSASAAYPLNLLCVYPFDGHTSGAPDPCRVRGPRCDEIGVTSQVEWSDRYAATPYASCAFNNDPLQFQLSIDVRPGITNVYGWNEVMIQTWPQDIPLQIPLEALYYSFQAYYQSDGLAEARFVQQDYFQITGRFLPIVFISLAAPDGRIFSYNPNDQISP